MSSTQKTQPKKQYRYYKFPEFGNEIFEIDIWSPDFKRLSKGGVPLTDEEIRAQEAKKFAQTGLGQIASAGIGVANAPTLGLAEFALGESGIVGKETLKALREANPLIQTGSEIAADIGLAVATGGASIAAKAWAKLGKEAAEGAIEQGARVAAKEASQDYIQKSVAKNGLEALAAPLKVLDKAGASLGEQLARTARNKGLGETAQRIANAAGRGAAPAAIYGALAEINESSLYDRELTTEAILQNILGGALLGSVGGAAVEGAARGVDSLRNKVNSYSKKLYPYIIGEDAAKEAAESGSSLIFGQKEIELLNALNLKIPQVDALAGSGDVAGSRQAFKDFADLVMSKTSPVDNQPLFISGLTPAENAKRITDYHELVGDSLKSIYSEASKSGVVLNKGLDDIISEAQNLLTKDGLPYDKTTSRQAKSIISDVLEPFRKKSMDNSDILRVNDSLADFWQNYKKTPGLENLSEKTAVSIAQAVEDSIKKLRASGSKYTYQKLSKEALSEFQRTRGDFYLKGTASYMAEEELARIAIKDIVGSSRKLTAKDISKIKSALAEKGKAFKASNAFDKSSVARDLYRYMNDNLSDAILGRIENQSLKQATADEFKRLKYEFAVTEKMSKKLARRTNMAAMHDRKGILSRITQGPPEKVGAVGAVTGSLLGGPIGAAAGYAAGYGLSKARGKVLELEKEVFPSIRARRAYEKAGIVVADSETRGFMGKIEKLAKDMDNNLGKKTQKKQGTGKSPQRFGLALSVLNAHAFNPKKESEEEKVAQFSDAFRVSSAGNGLTRAAEMDFDGTFGTIAQESMPQIRATVSQRATIAEQKLSALLPVSPNIQGRNPYTPLAKARWRASPIDTQRALRAIEAVQNPFGEIEAAASGDINVQALDLVKTIYPSLYESSMKQLLSRISDRKEPLTLQEKTLLNILLSGTDMEDKQFASMTSSIQSSLGTEEQRQNQNQQIVNNSKPLTQNAVNKLAQLKGSMGTFTDSLGTSSAQGGI